MPFIVVDDLPQSVKDAFEADELAGIVAGLNAKAERVAPCLTGTDPAPSEGQLAEAKLILLGTLKRWAEAGAGALTQRTQTAGPFNQSESYDTRQRTGYNLWPSEIAELQDVCSTGTDSDGAFMVDMAGTGVVVNPLSGAVVNRPEQGPTPIGSWSDETPDLSGWGS